MERVSEMSADRRCFLKQVAMGVGGLCVSPLFASEGIEVDGIALPDWAVSTIREGAVRYRRWKGTDETIAFPFITDTHSKVIGLPDGPVDWKDSKRHILFLRAIAHEVDADFISDLGDHDMEVNVLGSPMPMEDVKRHFDAYVSLYSQESLPILFSMGNHDHAKGRLSSQVYGDALNRGITQKKGHPVVLSEDGTWGYYDIPAKRFRMVFANTSDEGYLGLSRHQLQFIADAFGSTANGWTVALQQHAQVPRYLGSWRRFMSDLGFERGMMLMHLVDDFVHRRGNLKKGFSKSAPQGVYDGVRWDFGHAGAVFAGDFSGHTHLEAHAKIDGVAWTTRPGYGTVPRDCVSFGARDPKDLGVSYLDDENKSPRMPEKTMLIDLVAIKPTRRVVHVFRFGIGGEESELEYEY